MKKSIFALFVLLAFAVSGMAQNYTIQQYLNIRSAGSPSFSPDGKRMAYLTNVTGTNQVWVLDLPGVNPKQLTNYDDNISFVKWLPDGGGIIYGKAIGGDENTQFFWMKTDGSGTKDLTGQAKVRHNFAEISANGTKIYYASNKRNRTFFDIYSMEIATGKEELIYQQDGNNDLAAVNNDGSKFIVSRDGIEKSLDNNLYLVDAKTKQETLLTPHTDASQFGSVHFLEDGLIYASDHGRDFYNLTQMRLKNNASGDWSEANREVKVIDNVNNWDIGGIEINPNGRNFVYTVNAEGYSSLYMRGVQTGGKPLISTIAIRPSQFQLPGKGVVGGLTLSKDESKIAFTFSSAKHNSDIWIYDRKTFGLTQITDSDRAGISCFSFVQPELVKFKTFDGREIPAWYYKPRTSLRRRQYSFDGESKEKDCRSPAEQNAVNTKTAISGPTGGLLTKYVGPPYPVIVSVHGGPEGQSRPGFNPLFQYYLSRGYAVLDPNVRGSTGYGKAYSHLDDVEKREDSVKDLAAAHEWLVKNGGADPKRIAVMGGSYGGYMTMAAITLYPDLWAAAVNTVGIVNWETFLQNTSGYRRRQREVEYGMLDKNIDFLRAISPIRKIDKIKTPLFVIHGKNDPRVPYTEAEQVVKALKDRNAVVEYKLYDDEGHGISKLKNRLDLYPLVADFLDKYMK